MNHKEGRYYATPQQAGKTKFKDVPRELTERLERAIFATKKLGIVEGWPSPAPISHDVRRAHRKIVLAQVR